MPLVEVGAHAHGRGQDDTEQQPRHLPAEVEEKDREPGVGREPRPARSKDAPGVDGRKTGRLDHDTLGLNSLLVGAFCHRRGFDAVWHMPSFG